MIDSAANVTTHRAGVLVSGDLTSVGHEAGGSWSESNPTESHSVNDCQGTHRNFNCQVSSLQVSGSSRNLKGPTLGVQVEAVQKHSDHRVVVGSEGRT